MGDLIIAGCTAVFKLVPALTIIALSLDFLGSFFFGRR